MDGDQNSVPSDDKKHQRTVPQPPPPSPLFDKTFSIYQIVNDTHRYEGDGIWNRFNIVVTLHMVLFGVVAFLYSSKEPRIHRLVGLLSIGGCLLSAWAIYVLRRLWLWHTHWKNTLCQIESSFPAGLARPFSTRPVRLARSTAWYQTWFFASTQPFLIILFSIWLALAIFSLTGTFRIPVERTGDTSQASTPHFKTTCQIENCIQCLVAETDDR